MRVRFASPVTVEGLSSPASSEDNQAMEGSILSQLEGMQRKLEEQSQDIKGLVWTQNRLDQILNSLAEKEESETKLMNQLEKDLEMVLKQKLDNKNASDFYSLFFQTLAVKMNEAVQASEGLMKAENDLRRDKEVKKKLMLEALDQFIQEHDYFSLQLKNEKKLLDSFKEGIDEEEKELKRKLQLIVEDKEILQEMKQLFDKNFEDMDNESKKIQESSEQSLWSLTEEMDEVRSSLHSLVVSNFDSTAAFIQFEDSNKSLQKNLEVKERELKNDEEETEKLKAENTSLESSLAAVDDDMKSMTLDLEQFELELMELEEKMEEMEIQHKTRVEQLNQTILETEQSIEKMTLSLEEQKALIPVCEQSIQGLDAKIKENQAENEKFQETIETLKTEVFETEKECGDVSFELSRLTDDNSLDTTIESMEKEKMSLDQQVSILSSKNMELEQMLEVMEKNLEKKREELEKLQKKDEQDLKQLKEVLNKKRQDLKEMKDKDAQEDRGREVAMNGLKRQMKQLLLQQKESDKKVERLAADIHYWKKSTIEFKKKVEELESQEKELVSLVQQKEEEKKRLLIEAATSKAKKSPVKSQDSINPRRVLRFEENKKKVIDYNRSSICDVSLTSRGTGKKSLPQKKKTPAPKRQRKTTLDKNVSPSNLYLEFGAETSSQVTGQKKSRDRKSFPRLSVDLNGEEDGPADPNKTDDGLDWF